MGRVRIIPALRRLNRNQEGGALVEFGVILPVMLLVFALSIEAARTFWSYQATIAGVRDAARYVGRAIQPDICEYGADLTSMQSRAEDIIRNSSDGSALFPGSISVDNVSVQVNCFVGEYKDGRIPVAKVEARLNITYPFQGLFDLMGVELLPAETIVGDQQRVFGA